MDPNKYSDRLEYTFVSYSDFCWVCKKKKKKNKAKNFFDSLIGMG